MAAAAALSRGRGGGVKWQGTRYLAAQLTLALLAMVLAQGHGYGYGHGGGDWGGGGGGGGNGGVGGWHDYHDDYRPSNGESGTKAM